MRASSVTEIVFDFPAKSQLCTSGFADLGGSFQHSPMLKGQMVVQHLSFTCDSHVITQWEALVRTHGPMQRLSRLDFQIWRLDREQERYYMAGSNSCGSDQEQSCEEEVMMQGGRLVLNIGDPRGRIAIAPGDIIGIFFQGKGIELKYRSRDDDDDDDDGGALIYLASGRSGAMLETFAADLAQDAVDGVFRKVIKGVPLVRVQIAELESGM